MKHIPNIVTHPLDKGNAAPENDLDLHLGVRFFQVHKFEIWIWSTRGSASAMHKEELRENAKAH